MKDETPDRCRRLSVVEICLEQARKRGIPVTLYCDTSHILRHEDAETVVVSKGTDSADFALGERPCAPGDLAVTQDYGLAAMCLSRKARVLRQDGLEYTDDNIGSLLLARHTARKIRRGGGRLHGPKKRDAQQDAAFEAALIRVLDELTRG